LQGHIAIKHFPVRPLCPTWDLFESQLTCNLLMAICSISVALTNEEELKYVLC